MFLNLTSCADLKQDKTLALIVIHNENVKNKSINNKMVYEFIELVWCV